MYSIKEISEMIGMTEHTIRYYTDQGLFPCKRDKNQRRIFDEESINWLIDIKCLKGCGMSIGDIKKYGDLCLEGNSTLEKRYQIILERKKIAIERLKEAQEILKNVEEKLRHYEDVISHGLIDDTNPDTRKLEDFVNC